MACLASLQHKGAKAGQELGFFWVWEFRVRVWNIGVHKVYGLVMRVDVSVSGA